MEAKSTLNNAAEASKKHSSELLEKTQAFKKQQVDIGRRLMIVTRSETSVDAVKKFESSMENLRRLDIAHGYIQILTRVEQLRFECYPECLGYLG